MLWFLTRRHVTNWTGLGQRALLPAASSHDGLLVFKPDFSTIIVYHATRALHELSYAVSFHDEKNALPVFTHYRCTGIFGE